MKKLLKFFLILTCIAGVLLLSFTIYFACVTSGYRLEKQKLVGTQHTLEFYDVHGNEISAFSGDTAVSEDEEIPSFVKNAFIAVEDRRFYKHNGIDKKALMRAMWNNIKSFSLKEGASTISQQLIKNTHLTNEKTLKRKLIEFKLTRQLEKNYSKDEILEMYLNTIYFGKNSYGITSAAKNYFNVNVSDLSLSQAAVLAGLIKAPTAYSPANNMEKCRTRRDTVLKLMKEQGYISETEFAAAVAEDIALSEGEKSASAYYIEQAKEEFERVMNFSPYALTDCKIYTYYDPEKQALLSDYARGDGYDFTGIILNNEKNAVNAYYSQSFDDRRQAGSVLKPLAVYAPAIDAKCVSECSPILDEKTDFNGYSPSNYGDAYYGYISVKESLEKSSNVCAVKLLNYVGTEKACKYLRNLGINVSDGDENLALALGTVSQGVTLKELASAYTAFSGNGEYQSPVFIEKIEVDGALRYRYLPMKKRVFSESTAYLMNYMLKGVSENGTAKKIGALKKEIASKTGTVGGKNGNTDAYNVSYSPEFTIAVRLSAKDELMPNNITGGGAPTTKAFNIWKKLKTDDGKKFSSCADVVKVSLDKTAYEKDHLLVLADEIAPAKCKIEGYFAKDNVPKEIANRFSSPRFDDVKFTVNNNIINIKLCLTEYCDFYVYREVNGKRKLIFDSAGKDCEEYSEEMTDCGKVYAYYVVPYYNNGGTAVKGAETLAGKALCGKTSDLPDDWWNTDF